MKRAIPRAVKDAIVDRMFTAEREFGGEAALARILAAEYQVKPATITASWRRWARERKPSLPPAA